MKIKLIFLLLFLILNFTSCINNELGNTILNFLNSLEENMNFNLIGKSRNDQNKAKSIKTERINNFRFKTWRNGNGTNEAVVPEKTSLSENNNKTTNQSLITDLNDPNKYLEDWLTISSLSFKNPNKYPPLQNKPIPLFNYTRKNNNYAAARSQGAWSMYAFYFKARGSYVYYTSTKFEFDIIDSIYVSKVESIIDMTAQTNKTDVCFNIYDYTNSIYKLCAKDRLTKLKWMCSIQQFLNQNLDYSCIPEDEKAKKIIENIITNSEPPLEIKKLIQNVIVIPTRSKTCNENWNYINKGSDWECKCMEGMQQSPIDLPNIDRAIPSPLSPMFSYDIVSSTSEVTTIDGMLQAGEQIKIRYDKGAIRIYHPQFGKIVAMDGAVYVAEEISFHTPSEHKINGVSYDMEMQIIHYGRSKGDINKQYILSFLFKKKPGVYNKFIDKLDFFNLPSIQEPELLLNNDIYIPNIFYTTEDLDIPIMQSFSFFTYEGSLTMPPCSERTTHLVASDPIPVSNTIITMFKEALKVRRRNSVENNALENNRDTQPLNGRTVYAFDHRKYGCVEYKQKPKMARPTMHYEKQLKESTDYFYVGGEKPSNIPGALVVPQWEALGQNEPSQLKK
jgi:carbonic anhydrase